MSIVFEVCDVVQASAHEGPVAMTGAAYQLTELP